MASPTVIPGWYQGEFGITPDGVIDGVNTVFTLPTYPNPLESTLLFLNGLLQRFGSDFTLVDNTITYTVPPTAGDWHLAYYRKGS
jgi:hypothetical protein